MGWIPISDAGKAVDGVRAVRGVDIGGDLLLDAGVDGLVDEVDIEGSGISAALVSISIGSKCKGTYLTESHFTVKESERSISAPFLGSVTDRAGLVSWTSTIVSPTYLQQRLQGAAEKKRE